MGSTERFLFKTYCASICVGVVLWAALTLRELNSYAQGMVEHRQRTATTEALNRAYDERQRAIREERRLNGPPVIYTTAESIR